MPTNPRITYVKLCQAPLKWMIVQESWHLSGIGTPVDLYNISQCLKITQKVSFCDIDSMDELQTNRNGVHPSLSLSTESILQNGTFLAK